MWLIAWTHRSIIILARRWVADCVDGHEISLSLSLRLHFSGGGMGIHGIGLREF